MANCPKCGAVLKEGSQFCVSCGFSLVSNSGATNGVNAGSPMDKVVGFFKKLNYTTDYTAQCDPNDSASNHVLGILAYIPLLFLIPYFAAKNSRFAQFHANQGLLATIVFFALGIVNTIVDMIIGLIFGIGSVLFLQIIGNIFCWIIGVVSGIVFLYFMVIGIINAAKRTLKELPIIGSFRILK